LLRQARNGALDRRDFVIQAAHNRSQFLGARAVALQQRGLRGGFLLRSGQCALSPLPLVAVPDTLEFLQIAAQQPVFLGAFRLPAQRAPTGHQFVQDVPHALQIALGLLNAAECFLPLAQLQGDASGLLKERAARLRPQGKRGVDQPLADHRVLAASQAGTA